MCHRQFAYPGAFRRSEGLTYGTLTKQQKSDNRGSYNLWDIAVSLLVIGIVVYVMTSFTG